MNKQLLMIMCLLALVYTQNVFKKNQCSDCAQFRSLFDCTNEKIADSCEWVEAEGTNPAKCQKRTSTTSDVPKTFCQLVENPETGCAKTFGCAYLNGACSHFAGCSAYVKTTTAECQAISYLCVSDGVSCIEAKECKDYTIAQCESTPSISGIKKCKWNSDAGICRDYACFEADSTLTTNDQCKAWLGGCVTRMKGCWTSPLPQCSAYDLDTNQCAYRGSDGLCEPDTASTKCKVKDCANAPVSITTDDECKIYQDGCITNGKGCIKATSKPSCSAYSGDNTTCVGYIGSDGICEGDAAGTKCRARKCENGLFTTDELCKNYQASCVTNGKQCVLAKVSCTTYKGTTTTCAQYIGTDGYCKGTSAITEAACAPKVCEEAPATNTTNDACNKYQIDCVTTGAGCSTKANLKSCSTYDGDASSCLSKVGSEGNCTWKSGTKCVARTCESASTTLSSNTTCANYFTNCVTTGAGCVSSTTCDLTVKQPSCEGTKDCGWQPVCTGNEGCSAFKKKSICLANQARVYVSTDDDGVQSFRTQKCAWLNNNCKNLECSDLTGAAYTTHTNCSNELSTCMSNLVDGCINMTDCSRLKGTRATCLGYPGYCTNTDAAQDSTMCSLRVCTDNTTATDNTTCQKFFPGCISNGAGCVTYSTQCTSFKGTQTICNTLFGYLSGTITNFTTQQCYNANAATQDTPCSVKTCESAENITDTGVCTNFLTGTVCAANGNGSCLDPKAASTTCGSYKGDAAFCEAAIVGENKAKYCFGTSTVGQCKQRECTDNTTALTDGECENFMSGCIVKSETGGGCIEKKDRLCSAQNGDTTTCSRYSGGLLAADNITYTKVQCTKYDSCVDRACSDKTTPTSQDDCMNYKSTCRYLEIGQSCFDYNDCTSYSFPSTATTDQQKYDYCSTIKDKDGYFCGFLTGDSKCSDRTCEQVNNSNLISKPLCETYVFVDDTNGNVACKSAGSVCYKPETACTSYDDFGTATDDATKKIQCQKYKDADDKQCNFETSGTTCTDQSTCELLVIQTSAKICNDYFSNGICQYQSNVGCLTITDDCSDYNFDSNLSEQVKKTICSTLKKIDNTANFGDGDAVYTPCVYKSSNSCSNIANCADIPSATNQADCDRQFSGCYYYGNKCYAEVASCPSSFPPTVTTNTQKSLYCNSIYNGTNYCQLKSDSSACENNANTDCVFTAPSLNSWDNGTFTVAKYCLAKTDKTKKIFCIQDDTTKCKAGTCEDIPSPGSQGDCDNRVIGCVFYNNKCYTSQPGASGTNCSNTSKVSFPSSLSAKSTAALTYCKLHKDCSYDQHLAAATTNCIATLDCDEYTLPTSSQSSYCLSQKNKNGVPCAYTSGTACRNFDCYDIKNATSQIDCDAYTLLKCYYYKGTCISNTTGCDYIPAGTSGQKAFCDALSSNSEDCTYISGANCTKKVACTTYDVSSVTNSNKKSVCDSLVDDSSPSGKCTYLWGDACVDIGTCDSYDGSSTDENGPEANQENVQCKRVIDKTTDYPCIGAGDGTKKCKAQVCTDNNASANDCKNNAEDCVYFNNKCFTKSACSSYGPEGNDNNAKQKWCEGITDINGDLCAWDSANAQCKDRTCDDKAYYTNEDCASYLKSCKTDGTKCVAKSIDCSSLKGLPTYCESILDSTLKDRCVITSTLDTTSGVCWDRTCYDNVTAQSDSECESFLTGCVTRGKGCIPRSEPCKSYRGTKQKCEAFKQYNGLDSNQAPIYVYCSGDSANTDLSPCKDRICSDNTLATDDVSCGIYLKGCVTKGTGCIEATAPCSSYKGDQATCAKFKGTSGADYCWNISTAAAQANVNCTKKLCSDIAGTNNESCNNGMKPTVTEANPNPNPLCVYDGTGCIDYGKGCSSFTGTDELCQTVIATDGPCKGTTAGTIKGACAKRVCTEAPNSLATDTECKKYHPDCSTTGYGCTATKQCSNLTTSASCQSRPECTWTNQCYTTATSCSTYSGTNYSTCVNSKQADGTQCAWVELTNKCQAQTCEDQPASYTTHEKCNGFSTACTTTGAGCITRKSCDKYSTPSVCTNASINADGTGRCGWDTQNRCRDRICTDSNGATNEACNTFLTGCVTNGSQCVTGMTCSEFVNRRYCLQSKSGPCLWMNGTCQNYDRCEDAQIRTHNGCQEFSGLCTTNGTNCIPITSCALTLTKVACVIGTDGNCGWLPSGKCQKFGQCSDAVASNIDDCKSYGSNCVTDGTTCVTVGKCSEYGTLTACGNLGTDGVCFWNAASNSCKLKECTDIQSSTYDACKIITLGGGACTTNGTTCIPLGTCSSYVEAGCFIGTDGDCIFALPYGAKTGTKACRPRICEDIADGKNNASCQGVIRGRLCVSNGISCIARAACSSYKVATACYGGGLEGTNPVICAFTPKSDTDKVNGTCKTFSACADANKDQAACTSNPSCKWISSAAGTSCAQHTCQTYASGADCQPIPSFDKTSFTVCVLQNATCQASDPGTMTDSKMCYTKSAYTYTWNQATSKCEGCSSSSIINNSINGSTNGTNGTDTATDFDAIISILSLGLLGFMA